VSGEEKEEKERVFRGRRRREVGRAMVNETRERRER
jgi:hypothetical protein